MPGRYKKNQGMAGLENIAVWAHDASNRYGSKQQHLDGLQGVSEPMPSFYKKTERFAVRQEPASG
jgi:hypothetical protein